MNTQLENGAVMAKTLELCQAIIEQPEFQSLRRDVDTFLGDDEAKRLYRLVAEKGELLHQKQHQGVSLSNEEVSDYEKHREALLKNPLATGFLDAQEQMHRIQETVERYVTKTMELGRVPAIGDFESCGSGCSCH